MSDETAKGKSGGSSPTKAGDDQPAKRTVPAWLELIVLVVSAVLISVAIKTFFVQMFFVPSESMQPQLKVDDRILVQKISYWRGEVQRGDVVVFRDPGGWLDLEPQPNAAQRVLNVVGLYPSGGHLVKRVIGVGGDRVVCCDKDGRITVNGTPLDESRYLRQGVRPSNRSFDVVVPEGRLWMMGDNRSNSEDSRFHTDLEGGGAILVDDVVGKVWAVVWPFSRFERLATPDTFDAVGTE